MRYTGIQLVREKLMAEGRIEAYDAVYSLTDPDGRPHRITRLAAVIHTLRHREGWDITTVDEPGKLAVYVLSSRPHLIPAGGETVATVSGKRSPECPETGCLETLRNAVPTLSPGWVSGRCPKHGAKAVKA